MYLFRVIAVAFLVLLGCKTNDSALNIRGEETDNRSIGLVYVYGSPVCSGSLLAHGVFVTAKHCFKQFIDQQKTTQNEFLKGTANALPIALGFPSLSGQESEMVMVPVSGVEKLVLDKGENDFAFIEYDKSLTENILTIPKISIASEIPGASYPVDLVGFPQGLETRVKSFDCYATDQREKMSDKVSQNMYPGILVGTTCEAWWGMSGGPVFMNSMYDRIFVGVVSHTFDVDEEGKLLKDRLFKDKFGKFARANFSPITAAEYKIPSAK